MSSSRAPGDLRKEPERLFALFIKQDVLWTAQCLDTEQRCPGAIVLCLEALGVISVIVA